MFFKTKPLPPVQLPLPKPIKVVQGIAYWLDNAFVIPGTQWRFGLDTVVGLLPGAGDIIMAIVGLATVALAVYYKMPWPVIATMLGNLALDFLIGLIPIIGDVADAKFKAHTRNVALLISQYQWVQPPSNATVTITR